MHEEATDALRDDDALGHLVEEYGPLALNRAEDAFERLVVSILRQQVSMDAAAAIRERLFDRVAVSPEGVLAADTETLTGAGLSAAKAEYVRDAARAFREEGYDRAYFANLSNEAVVDEITEIRGVGPWTAKMFLMLS